MAKSSFFSDLVRSGFSLYLDHSCFLYFSDVSFSNAINSTVVSFEVRNSFNDVLFCGTIQISRSDIFVSRLHYYDSLRMKSRPDELFLFVPYVSHKYRKLSNFLYNFHLALNSCLSEFFFVF